MEYVREYVKFLEQFINIPGKVRVLFDLSNGSTGLIMKELFKDNNNVEAIFVNDNMDGNFPGHGPNPLEKKVANFMREKIIENKVDLGVVFDGDGDRVFFFDNLGRSFDSYETFSYIKGDFKSPYVVDVRALSKFTMPDEDIIEAKVGRYFMVKSMKEHKAELGVEYSGHFYFKNFFYTDSGILASIYMVNYLSKIKGEGKALSETRKDSNFVRLSEENFSIDAPEETISKMREHFSERKDVRIETLDGLTVYAKDFAFNIRGSATEPVVRFTLVSQNNEILQETLEEAKKILNINE